MWLVRAWNRFWFGDLDPITLASFRIALGILFLTMLLFSIPNWERFYDAQGIVSLQDVELQEKRPEPDWWCAFAWTDDFTPIRFYWWLGFFASVAFILGFWTRLATVVLFILQTSMIHRNLFIVNGEDLVFRMLLFHACFAPLGACMSIDSLLRRRKGRPERSSCSIWPLRMMQLNVLLIYALSVPYKLADDDAWLHGESIYWTLASDTWSRGWFPELGYQYGGWFSRLATYGTLIVEGLFPFLVWSPKTRPVALAAATLLHLGIAVLVPGVLFFTLSMVVAFSLFVPPHWYRTLLARGLASPR